MLTGLTRREQRILLLLIGVITAGLAIYHFRDGSHRDIYITSPKNEDNLQKDSPGGRRPEIKPLTSPPLVNINTASLEELCSLHGIGIVKAKAIIDHRNAYGEFQAPLEITKVPGIGMSTFDRIKEIITVGEEKIVPIESENAGSSETVEAKSTMLEKRINLPVFAAGKVNINTAGMEELMTLEQIGEVKARRIIEYRSRYGQFHSVKDLLKIKGIGEKTLSLNRDKIILSAP